MAEPLRGKRKTRQQKRYVDALARTGDVSKACEVAGFADNSYGYFLNRQPHIQTMLQQALEKYKLNDDKVAMEIDNGLKATYVKKDKGEEYPDFHARHKYLDTLIKIKGGYAPEKHEIRQEKLTLIVTPDVLKGLKDADAITDDDAKAIEAEIVEEDNARRT